MGNRKMDSVSVIALVVTILAACAAILSALSAYKAWKHSIVVTKAELSLQTVEVKHRRSQSKEKLTFDIVFPFKNSGKIKARDVDIRVLLLNDKRDMPELKNKGPLMNVFQPGSLFFYHTTFSINVDPKRTNEQLIKILPELVGMTSIILFMRYNDEVTKEPVKVNFYFVYHGTGSVFLMNEEQYKDIEDKLPAGFKRGE